MSDVLGRVRLLARDCDIAVEDGGHDLLRLTADGSEIFRGSPDACLLYLRGWHDGRDRYIRYESRGANE